MSEYWKDYRSYASLHKQPFGTCSEKYTFHRVDLSPEWRVLGSLLKPSLLKAGFGIRWMTALICAGRPSPLDKELWDEHVSSWRSLIIWLPWEMEGCPRIWQELWCAQISCQALGSSECWVTNHRPPRSSDGKGNAEEPSALLEEPLLLG